MLRRPVDGTGGQTREGAPGGRGCSLQREVEHIIDGKNNSAYEAAVRLLRKVARLMALLERTAEFRSYLTGVRARHKPKRNLMKLLDQTKF